MCGVAVAVGALLGLSVGCGVVEEGTGVTAWLVPHALNATTRIGVTSRQIGVRMLARGFYGWGVAESIRRVLMFPARRPIRESRGLTARCCLISYPWTRVPKAVPPLDPWQLRLLPVADRFMALMWSRPGGLSLRTTWVTPATIGLGLAVAVALGVPGLGVMAYGIFTGQLLLALGGLVAAVLGTGGGTVAAYGIRQRLL